jgi:glycosyltransferase involved in cell wall biosynthesis
MSRPVLVLIVPCDNEAARLTPQAFADFAAANPSARLLFVDDGSTDGTCGVLEQLKASAPGSIDVTRLPSRQGKGEAVRRGHAGLDARILEGGVLHFPATKEAGSG